MSLPDAETQGLRAPVPARRMLLVGALLAAAFAGGCLRPLYAESTTSAIGGSVGSALKSIDIPEIKGLVGHYLRNELAFEFDGGGDPDAQKRLTFNTAVAESIQVVTVDYANGRADSAVLVATATWTLKRIDNGQTVAYGTNTARATYERSSQRFATVRAARDAQIRAAKSLAQLIKGQIAADLTSS